MIAQLKYDNGIPFYRLENLEEQLGIPLPAATQWEIVEEAAEVIKSAREELIRQAAQVGGASTTVASSAAAMATTVPLAKSGSTADFMRCARESTTMGCPAADLARTSAATPERTSSSAAPLGMTAGPDGALWFAEDGANKIRRITTGSSINEYAVPTPDSGLYDITVGPDGALWFTESLADQIGRVAEAFSFVPITPCRAVDTGNPDGPLATWLSIRRSSPGDTSRYSLIPTPKRRHDSTVRRTC